MENKTDPLAEYLAARKAKQGNRPTTTVGRLVADLRRIEATTTSDSVRKSVQAQIKGYVDAAAAKGITLD